MPLHGAGRVGKTRYGAGVIPVHCTIWQLNRRSFRFPNDRFGFKKEPVGLLTGGLAKRGRQLLHVVGDVDLEANRRPDADGVIAIEVLNDECHLAFLPFETEVFGYDDEALAAIIILDKDFERIDKGQRVPGSEILVDIVDVPYIISSSTSPFL